MKIKWFLIIAPALLSLALLQSYFWVPTYETQTKGNPDRVWKFIEASIGDAKILNPILNADTASGRIVGLVFDSLLDYDEELNRRGRLATDWTITEEAYLIINPDAQFPDGIQVTANAMKARISDAIENGSLPKLKELVTEITLLPKRKRTEEIAIPGADGKPISVEVKVQVPERLQFSLKRVDQNFFKLLEPIIGANYEKNVPIEKWVEVSPQEHQKNLRPQFAEFLPVFEHHPIILFHLRKGVHFHDGHEFDAGDVKFTYEALMNSKNLSPRTSNFEPIKTVEIVDSHTVRVVYKRLFSPAIDAWSIGILPEHLLNEQALQREMDKRGLSKQAKAEFGMRDSQFNRHPIGVGPFRFVKWQGDELIHLIRNDDYWEGAPEYKEFYYRIIPDAITQEVEFRTGAIDTYSPQPHQAVRYKKDDTYQPFSVLGFGYVYIGYNNRRPLFVDKRVRQALGMAINADEIIEYILYGEGEKITGPYPKSTQWYNHKVKQIPYDPKKAQRILAKLGWKKNAQGWLEKEGKIFEFNLITNNGNLQRKAIMTIAQNSWRKIGIKCNTQLFEWAVFLKDFVNSGQFDAVVLGWSMGMDPDLYQIWHSSQAGPQQLNFVGYNSPEVDQLIVQIRQEYDIATQRNLTHQLHSIIAEDQPYTFLYAPRSNLVLDKKIVTMEKDGSYSKIKKTKSGSVFFHFNRWRKLEYTPKF
ncbi:ABC transporter substrate-binding protein [Candidatus Parabeggiatoa sp. HSG14]|uniref:ABC transporter substrate-binding protein n=1 Tax=Candidatus Parabeggiatoa sp. HSG14 TaxID=3055593 RepID=UPI0025A85CE3|nr:ABC transporter substrate-binding protein [Thiotrichales bacterium HSG14]